ncbi:MAG: flagellar biosynthesis anti-sigma factor FlgM [Desulfuromonadaceae bacterium]
MKIDTRISSYMELLKNEPVTAATPAAQSAGTTVAAEAPSVTVDFSSSAVQLAEDEARRERLNIIRQQLAEGSYNISGKDVAEKMLKVLKG